jgi:hypothetical protein
MGIVWGLHETLTGYHRRLRVSSNSTLQYQSNLRQPSKIEFLQTYTNENKGFISTESLSTKYDSKVKFG